MHPGELERQEAKGQTPYLLTSCILGPPPHTYPQEAYPSPSFLILSQQRALTCPDQAMTVTGGLVEGAQQLGAFVHQIFIEQLQCAQHHSE